MSEDNRARIEETIREVPYRWNARGYLGYFDWLYAQPARIHFDPVPRRSAEEVAGAKARMAQIRDGVVCYLEAQGVRRRP